MKTCPRCNHAVEGSGLQCQCAQPVDDEAAQAGFFSIDDVTEVTERTERPGSGRPSPWLSTDEGGVLPPRSQEQGDPVILGDVSEAFEVVLTEETGSVLNAASEMSDESGPMRPAPVYVSANTAQLTEPSAVLAASEDVELPALTPFEAHVFSLLDGERSVEQLCGLSGLSLEDLRIALCMLGDKGLVHVKLAQQKLPQQEGPRPTSEVPELTDPTASPPFALREALEELSLSESTPEHEPVVMDAAALELTPLEPAPAPAPPAVEPAASPSVSTTKAPSSVADRQKAASVYELALRDINAGRFARARQYVKLATSLHPEEPRYQSLLDEWDKAREVAAEIEEPEAVKLAHKAGEAERSRDFVGAARLLDQAIALTPDDAALHNRLGVLCATRLKDFDRGTQALFRAVELAPTNATFRHNLLKVMGAAEAARDARFGGFGPTSTTQAKEQGAAAAARFKALLSKKLF